MSQSFGILVLIGLVLVGLVFIEASEGAAGSCACPP